jgi:hypothetical protein
MRKFRVTFTDERIDMPKFRITLTTVADLTMEVEANDEEVALDVAYNRAEEFADQRHGGNDYTVTINDIWALRNPKVKKL